MAKHWGASNCTHGGSIFWNKSMLLLTGDVFISFYRWQLGWRRIFINIALVPPPPPNISSRRSHSTERLPWLWSFPILHLILIFLVHFLWWHFFPRFGLLSQNFPLFQQNIFFFCKFLFSLHCVYQAGVSSFWLVDRVDIDNKGKKTEEGVRKEAPAARGWNSFASDFSSQTF